MVLEMLPPTAARGLLYAIEKEFGVVLSSANGVLGRFGPTKLWRKV